MKSFHLRAARRPVVLPAKWLLAVLAGALVGVGAGYHLRPPVSIVDGRSMEPSYFPGTSIVTAPVPGKLLRGDVVVLDDPEGTTVIKRIVGLPSETVQLLCGRVAVNGRLLVEPYLTDGMATLPGRNRTRETFELGPDEYFVLGDNRRVSLDSRSYGPVSRSAIHAIVVKPYQQARAKFLDLSLLPPSGNWPVSSSAGT